MFRALHEYVAQGLVGRLKEYIHVQDPRDAQVSLWAGGLTLHNVVLREDVVRRVLRLPATITSGRINELRVQVPIRFTTEPVTITITTMEIVLRLDDAARDVLPAQAYPPSNMEVGEGAAEAHPSYFAGFMHKLLSNISIYIKHLTLKLVDDDAALSLNIEELLLNSTDANWEPAFTDVDVMRRLLRLRNLTLCLDRRAAAGNIPNFQEPLLFRCDLAFRVTTHRERPRSTNTHVELECDDLSLRMSCMQLTMLHRLLLALSATRAAAVARQENEAHVPQRGEDGVPAHNAEEGEHEVGWSAWAWSWLLWSGGYDEAGAVVAARAEGVSRTLLVTILARKLTLTLKARERTVGVAGKRWHTRNVLKLCMERTALVIRSWDSGGETFFGARAGTRVLRLEADGPCVCGHASHMSEVYLRSLEPDEEEQEGAEGARGDEYSWPAMAAVSLEREAEGEATAASNACQALNLTFSRRLHHFNNENEDEGTLEEDCSLVINVTNMELTACAGAIHRVNPFIEAVRDTQGSPPPAAQTERLPLGVPKRLIRVVFIRPVLRLLALQHTTAPPVHLDLEAELITLGLDEPLYPLRRVRGARLERSGTVQAEEVRLMLTDAPAFPDLEQGDPAAAESRPNRKLVARLCLEYNTTRSLDPNPSKKDVVHCDSVHIREAGMCVSAARLRTAWLLVSAATQTNAPPPVVTPELARDALADQNAVHVDILMEHLILGNYYTSNVQLYTLHIRSVRATLMQALPEGEQEQAFLFMAPTTPNVEELPGKVFVRVRMLISEQKKECCLVQCDEISASVDPMLVTWLSDWRTARSTSTPDEAPTPVPSSHMSWSASSSSTQHSLLHQRMDISSRSHSSGERELERTHSPAHRQPASTVWSQRVINTLLHVCISVHVNELTVYAPAETVSALDCDSLPAAMDRHTCSRQYALSSPIVVVSVEQLSLDSHAAVQMRQCLTVTENHIIQHRTMDFEMFPELATLPAKMEVRQLRCFTMPPGVAEGNARARKRPKIISSPISVLKPHTTTVIVSVQNESVTESLPHRNKAPVSPAPDPELPPVVGLSMAQEVTSHIVRVKSSLCVYIDTRELELEVRFNQMNSIYRAGHLLSHVLEAVLPAPTAPAGAPAPAPSPSGTQSDGTSLFSGSPSFATTSAVASSAASPSSVSHSGEALRMSDGSPIASGSVGSYMDASLTDVVTRVHTVVWVQWVLQQATIQYHTPDRLQLTLSMEALSVIGEYLARSTHYKVYLADLQMYVESRGNSWRLLNTPGKVVVRPLLEPPESKLIDVIVTVATNKDLRKQLFGSATSGSTGRGRTSNLGHRQCGEVLLLEVVARIAPLEFTLNPSLLAPFVSSFVTATRNARALCCVSHTPRQPSNATAHLLLHLTCPKVIIQLPTGNPHEGNAECDTVVIQIEDVFTNPHPVNGIVRQPLRPDGPVDTDPTAPWFEKLQDRQHLIRLGGFSVHTSTWSQLQKGREAMASAQDNAALAWAQWGEALGPTPLLHRVIIQLTLAPTSTLYAAAAEFSTPEDVRVQVCVPQLRLLRALHREAADAVALYSNRRDVREVENRCQYRVMPEAPVQAHPIGAWGNAEFFATAKSVNITLYERGEQNGVVHMRITEPSLFLKGNHMGSTTNYQVSVYDLFVGFLSEMEPTTEDEDGNIDLNGEPPGMQSNPVVTIPMLETTRGEPHHTTHVLPALLTIDVKPVITEEGSRLEVKVSVERPVRLTVCEERARQTHRLHSIVKEVFRNTETAATDAVDVDQQRPELAQRVNTIFDDVLESVELKTKQLVVQLARAGTTECDSVSCGLSTLEGRLMRHVAGRHARGERGLHLCALVEALAVSAPSVCQDIAERSLLLHPVTFGVNARVLRYTLPAQNCGRGHQLRLLLDAGCITLEAAPHHLAVLSDVLSRVRAIGRIAFPPDSRAESSTADKDRLENVPSQVTNYEDDMSAKPPLGAFRIVHMEENFPSPFEMAIGPDSVTWCYPMPRVITSVVLNAFPMISIQYGATLADIATNGIPLALEWYCEASEEFQLVRSFVLDERCSHKFAPPPFHEICARIWRVRIAKPEEREDNPLDLAARPFVPAAYSLNPPSVHVDLAVEEHVIMRMVADGLHIWSQQNACVVPTTLLVAHATSLKLHVRLSANPESALETLSTPRTALSLHAEHSPVLHVQMTPTITHIAAQLRAHAYLLDPYNMRLERILGPSLVRVRCQRSKDAPCTVRAYMHTLDVVVSPHHLRMLRKLQRQWAQAQSDVEQEELEERKWMRYSIANHTERQLHVGQLQTTNGMDLQPGDQSLFHWWDSSYRLKTTQALAPHALGVALRRVDNIAKLDIDKEGMTTIRLETHSASLLHMNVTTRVEPCGTMLVLMEGRLHLANMTTYNLMYEVWESKPAEKYILINLLCSGKLPALSTDNTALCCEVDLDKLIIRYRLERKDKQQLYWTGGVPLGARAVPGRPELARARGTPWLTKLEVEDGKNAFVWNRTVHEPAPSGRLLVMLWPLYLVTSELPLDVLARVQVEANTQQQELSVPGRGATTIIPLSGKPSTVYNCTFRYRDVEAPLTEELVPLHYGLNKQPDITTPTADIGAVLAELKSWVANLRNDVREQEEDEEDKPVWPYSVVSRHRACAWQPSPLPPHTDLNIEYRRVRTKSDGSGFKLVLKPQSLFCNATTRTLTVRTVNSLLFTVQEGHVVAPPAAFPQMPGWMVSICAGPEGVERWVSCEMSVVDTNRGPYERVPAGELTLLQPASLHMISADSAEMLELSLYYEMHDHIQIIGASTTLVLRNITPDVLLVCGIAIWMDGIAMNDTNRIHDLKLFPRQFQTLPPHDVDSYDGMPFDLFTIQGYTKRSLPSSGHWRMFLCFALHCPSDNDDEVKHVDFVPIRYNTKPQDRRTLALRAADGSYRGYCATVQQLQPEQEGRRVVEVGEECHAQYRVRNHSTISLMIATTLRLEGDEEHMKGMAECEGAAWERCLPPSAELLYSSPAHCAWRVAADPAKQAPAHRLLLGTHCPDDCGVLWVPVDVTSTGHDAQLVRLTRDLHVKVFVQRGLRESLLTICHIESHDMSARDIRERLANSDAPVAAPNVEVLNENATAGTSSQNLPAPNPPPQQEKHKWDVGVFVESTKLTFQEPYGGHRNMLHLYIDDAAVTVCTNDNSMDVNVTVRGLQADNAQRTESNVAYDFPVVLEGDIDEEFEVEPHPVPPMWTVQLPIMDNSGERMSLDLSLLFCRHNRQANAELYKLEARCPSKLKLYVEDKYLTALLSYVETLRAPRRAAAPPPPGAALAPRDALLLSAQLRHPLSMRRLQLCEMQLDLSLRSNQWLYLALNSSPVKLNAFEREEFSTRPARLSRILIYHYLTGAVLRAGWMIGSLEALGAPGTLVRRVGMAVHTGGALQLCGQVAAGTLDSVSTLCSSLARNLDVLTGDEEYASLAAEQRRQRPRSLPHALITGITGFIGATFGGISNLVQGPFTAPRAALLGVIAKPLSAAADLVSMSSQGLLNQAGWEAHPQPRTWMTPLTEEVRPMDMTILGDGSLVIQEHNVRYADASTILLVTSKRIMLLNERNVVTATMGLNQIRVEPPQSPPDRIIRLRPLVQHARPTPPQPRPESDSDAEIEVEAKRPTFAVTLLSRRDAVIEVTRAAEPPRPTCIHLDSEEAELELRALLSALARNDTTGFNIL